MHLLLAFSHLTIDHASLSRRSTVPTPNNRGIGGEECETRVDVRTAAAVATTSSITGTRREREAP